MGKYSNSYIYIYGPETKKIRNIEKKQNFNKEFSLV